MGDSDRARSALTGVPHVEIDIVGRGRRCHRLSRPTMSLSTGRAPARAPTGAARRAARPGVRHGPAPGQLKVRGMITLRGAAAPQASGRRPGPPSVRDPGGGTGTARRRAAGPARAAPHAGPAPADDHSGGPRNGGMEPVAGPGAKTAERPIAWEVDAALPEVHSCVVTRTYPGGGPNDSGGNSDVHRA